MNTHRIHRAGRFPRALAIVLACAGSVVLATVCALLLLLRAAPGEWSAPLWIGPLHARLSVAALIRVGTHPSVLRWLEGRTLRTRFGTVQWQAANRPHSWRAVCAPCRLSLESSGDDAIVVARLELVAERMSQTQWRGEFALGEGPRSVHGDFGVRMDPNGVSIALDLPDTTLSDAYLQFASVVPEATRASIEGRLRLNAQWRLPQHEWTIHPQVEGFRVTGLGTEALLDATPACEPARHGFGRWLPRAVLAAEDQRFYTHTGVDLRELRVAWTAAGDDARGASTLSQQLAKLVYTGDARTHSRKLRELLYAVELDRTLGKARVLNLYLAMAPWGDGICGAAAASKHYLHKRVDRLTPTEAAWLASLLHNPDADWQAFQRRGQVDVERVSWVIAHLRPMPASRREALMRQLPGWSPAVSPR